jgi:hypothetical protein
MGWSGFSPAGLIFLGLPPFLRKEDERRSLCKQFERWILIGHV